MWVYDKRVNAWVFGRPDNGAGIYHDNEQWWAQVVVGNKFFSIDLCNCNDDFNKMKTVVEKELAKLSASGMV